MEWGKLYANLPDDPRVQAAEASDGAAWLLVESMCYCTRAERAGFIPRTQVERFGGARLKQRVAALVREQLWLPVDGGYLLNPDVWTEERNLGDSAEKKRKADRERQAAKREAERKARVAANGSGESRDMSHDSRATDPATCSGDSRGPYESREEKTHTAGLVDQLPVAGAPAKTDDDDETVSRVAGALAKSAGHIVTETQARRAIRVVLNRAERSGTAVGDVAGYVIAAIETEGDPYRELLLAPAAELAAELLGEVQDRLPWCRVCDPETRQLDRDGDNPRRCPDCHPETTRRLA
jgi:hypothetical protein